MARTKVLNFATENNKGVKNKDTEMNTAEGASDVFGRILAVAPKTSDALDVCHVLSYPITEVPLSLAIMMGLSLRQ